MIYIYMGNLEEIFPGLPTRDLTQAEWDAAPISDEAKEVALSSGMFVAINEDE